jgi:hypothetical protein
MDKPYSIALQGIDALPAAEKIAAEVRFVKSIERSLGSAEVVVLVYRAWLEASESEATEVSKGNSNFLGIAFDGFVGDSLPITCRASNHVRDHPTQPRHTQR